MFGPSILALLSTLFAATQGASSQSCLIQKGQASLRDAKSLLAEVDDADADPKTSPDTSMNTADLAGTLKDMMEKIDKSTTKGHNATSPDVVEAVNKMMAEFQTMAVAKFKKAFTITQAALQKDVEDLKTATAHLDTLKVAADHANMNLVTCRKGEMSKLKIKEDCHTQGLWFNKTSEDACKEMEDAQYHEWDVDEDLAKMQHCDLNNEDCGDLDEMKKHVDEHFRIAESKRATYQKKIENCKVSKKTAVDNEVACITKSAEFVDKQEQCDFEEYQRTVNMCEFGSHLQVKCDKYAKLMDLLSQTREGRGTEHSEVERMSMWAKAMTMKCMLKSYTGHGGINEAVKETCLSDVNYKRDVGVMDYMSSEIASQMRPAPPMFTCQEKAVRFVGDKVTVGETAAEYNFDPLLEPTVILAPLGDAVFSFCLPNATKADCRGFSCPVGMPAKPTPETQTCKLAKCTKFECCEIKTK